VSAVENRSSHADHAGTDLTNAHLQRGGGHADEPEDDQQARNRDPAKRHEVSFVIREKCLSVKEKWALRVDNRGGRLLWSASLYMSRVPRNLRSFSPATSVAAVSAYGWRYWSDSEEAFAVA